MTLNYADMDILECLLSPYTNKEKIRALFPKKLLNSFDSQ